MPAHLIREQELLVRRCAALGEIRDDLLAKGLRTTGLQLGYGKIGAFPASLGDAVLQMLTTGLALTANMREERDTAGAVFAVTLNSVAAFRDSQILPSGWRESVDFDLQIYEDREQSKLAAVRLNGVAHALVSRQALGSLSQYQGLDDAQRAIYGTALDTKTDAAIATACPGYKKIDASTISCD